MLGHLIDQDCDGHGVCYPDADHDDFRTTDTIQSEDADCDDAWEAHFDVQLDDCDDSGERDGVHAESSRDRLCD